MNEEHKSAEDMIKSLTYFDELAIEAAFGKDWSLLAQEKPVTLMRALCFVELRRNGKNDPEAKQAAFEMSLDAVQGAWVEENEVDPEDPVTGAGKGDDSSA